MNVAPTPSAPVSRLGYRPELDGLRAIAIIVVVSIHYTNLPHGGLLGVDIFFTLSGFLITTLLLEEWQAKGSISLRNFYLRRYPSLPRTRGADSGLGPVRRGSRSSGSGAEAARRGVRHHVHLELGHGIQSTVPGVGDRASVVAGGRGTVLSCLAPRPDLPHLPESAPTRTEVDHVGARRADPHRGCVALLPLCERSGRESSVLRHGHQIRPTAGWLPRGRLLDASSTSFSTFANPRFPLLRSNAGQRSGRHPRGRSEADEGGGGRWRLSPVGVSSREGGQIRQPRRGLTPPPAV